MAYKWKNLRANKCPVDGNKLTRTANGWECGKLDGYYQERCKFFISDRKMDELKERLRI